MSRRLFNTSLFLLTLFATHLNAQESAEKLFDTKCLMCHAKTRPDDISKLVAPPIMGVMQHVKMRYTNKDNAVAFMVDYIFQPNRTKSVCMADKIEKFGLMPSQKDMLTQDEAIKISNWLYDNYPPQGFRGMGQGRGAMGGQGKNWQ